MSSRFIGGKRRIAVLVAVLAGLAIGVSIAVAKSGPTQLTVQILRHNPNCGAPSTKKPIGSAKVTVEKGVMTVVGHLHGAEPGKYDLFLYSVPCGFVADLDTFGVDGSGDGNFSGSIAITGQPTLVLEAFNRDLDISNDSVGFKVAGT
jgi:hypothetical protein